MLEDYPQGAWLVELAPLADPDLIPKTVASALNLPEIPGKTVTEALVDFLRYRRLLLILDNCEHLLEACADLADQLVHACPNLSILASSREFLGVEGEVPYRVPPMVMPDPRHLPSLQEFNEFDAVRLFAERARVAAPNIEITANNAPLVAQVVTRLDGIPLAIELAAARLRLLGLEQLARRLDDSFRLLTGGSRSKLPRHQTLRASIDWSYNLLSEAERILLRRLSIFAGSWRLQAAEQVCAYAFAGCQPLCPEDILDLLSNLVDKSLVITDHETAGRVRYRMLETIRQYSHEKLVDEKEAEGVRTRHLAYYLELATELSPKIRGPEHIETLDRLELELDNLRLALEWSLQSDVEAELKLATALQWFWHHRSLWSEGIRWLEQGLEHAKALSANPEQSLTRDIARARAMTALAFHLSMQRNWFREPHKERIEQLLNESYAILGGISPAQYPGVKRDIAWVLCWQGKYQDWGNGEDNNKVTYQGALSLFREVGDQHGIDECLLSLGYQEIDPLRRIQIHQEVLAVALTSGDIERISSAYHCITNDLLANGDYYEAYQVSLALNKLDYQVNNQIMVASRCLSLGNGAQMNGNLGEAQEWINQAMIRYRNLGIDNQVDFLFWCRFNLAMAEGSYEQAGAIIEEAWTSDQQVHRQSIAWVALYGRARLARIRGDEATARQYAEKLVGIKELGANFLVWALLEMGHLALHRSDFKLAETNFKNGLQDLLQEGTIFWVYGCLDALAHLAARTGKMERAARLYGSRWCRGGYYFLSPLEKAQREADFAAMRTELGERRFEQLHEEAVRMPFVQAIALALEDSDE
jgi:predicted ATPase